MQIDRILKLAEDAGAIEFQDSLEFTEEALADFVELIESEVTS